MKRTLLAILALALALPASVFAQRTTTQPATAATFTLTLQVNVPGAQLFIDGVQVKGLVNQVAAGTHTVTAKLKGFNDFSTTVNVTGNMALPITLTRAAPTLFALSVNAANVKGAQVLLNGAVVGSTPYRSDLASGSYTVTVRAPGYADYNESFSLSGPKSINCTLQSMSFTLSVNANVAGAQVLLNGSVVGATPFRGDFMPGSYTVTVQAPGFLSYSESFSLSGPKSISATLQAATFPLSVNVTNVRNAQVLLNGTMAGNAPFNTQVAPGTYTVTIQAPGYTPYTETVMLTGPKSISVALQPAMGMVTITLPAASINTDMKGGHWSQIFIYVDGVQQKSQMLQLAPGRHLIRIVSGGLAVEGFYDIQPGQSYTIEPFLGLNLKP